MDLLVEVPAGSLQVSTQQEVTWVDLSAPVGVNSYYRITAFDSERPPNESASSKVGTGRSLDTVPPLPPELLGAEWVIYDGITIIHQPWPASIPAPFVPGALLSLALKGNASTITISRKDKSVPLWTRISCLAIAGSPNPILLDPDANPSVDYAYVATAWNAANVGSLESKEIALARVSP
jgi:hypothetical protein